MTPRKKRYGTPFIVAQEVDRVVNDSNNLVIQLVLERVHGRERQLYVREEYGVNEDWHKHHTITNRNQQGCGCIYCQALSKYVNTKMSAHRLRKRLDNWDYVYDSIKDAEATQQLAALEKEWPILKKAKNQIKAEIGY